MLKRCVTVYCHSRYKHYVTHIAHCTIAPQRGNPKASEFTLHNRLGPENTPGPSTEDKYWSQWEPPLAAGTRYTHHITPPRRVRETAAENSQPGRREAPP